MFVHVDEKIAWNQIHSARTDLAQYLSTLSEDQWNHASLCSGWRNRDVVAHLIIEYTYNPSEYWLDFIKSCFNINSFMKQTAIKRGNQPTPELLKQFIGLIGVENRPSNVSVINVLADLLVHEQDIRIPIGQTKKMPHDKVNLVFSSWEPTKYNFGEKIAGVTATVKGLEFIATDIGLSKGQGLKVEGTAEDILMTIVGRSTSLDRLTGIGVEVLRERVKSS